VVVKGVLEHRQRVGRGVVGERFDDGRVEEEVGEVDPRRFAGRRSIAREAFTLPDDASQTLFIYTPAGTDSEQAMAFLANWWSTDHAVPERQTR
jgi:hypothetical protein